MIFGNQKIKKECPDLGSDALTELLLLGSTYMCDVLFSALTHVFMCVIKPHALLNFFLELSLF